jgi:hypothetical protein
MVQMPTCVVQFSALSDFWTFLLVVVVAAGFTASIAATEPPRIDRIELFQTSQVTVHFDTEPNRTYELQFRNQSGTTNAPWTNIFVAPKIPFPNHYIVVDTRTNRARIYRLRVTP